VTNGLESAPVLTRACDLVIFDCDGVLVDSERISGRVFSEQLAELGLVFTLPEMIETFMGSSMQRCVDIVTERLGTHSACRLCSTGITSACVRWSRVS
jgi:phosphoglycolate phosphatase-like HAD superfamily hydrolase